jgi:hypothetical protein
MPMLVLHVRFLIDIGLLVCSECDHVGLWQSMVVDATKRDKDPKNINKINDS